MSRIEWKNESQLDSHYNKHVLGVGLPTFNNKEPQIWIKHNMNLQPKKEEYEEISKDNCKGNHYLCKDKSSNSFSINYCNNRYNDEDYLLTCTKLNDNDRKIYSCYYTDIEHIHPFLNIYYFVNNLEKSSDYQYISKDFTKYELNNTFDRYYKKTIKEFNLNNPKYSNKEEITLLQMGILKFFLEENSYSKINNKNIWINKLLYKKINSILYNKKYELSKEENIQLVNIKKEIDNYKNDKESYNDNKDSIDLLIEINNFINDKYLIKSSKNSRWTMFNNFKEWNNKE